MPILYAIRGEPQRLSVWGRALGLAVAAGCLAVLVVAARTQPSPAGVGTHEGLGLQPCSLLARTGLPCPSCGMTTSFAWFVRGNILASLYVQPMGAVLALLTGWCVWGGLYAAISGRPAHHLLRLVPSRYYLIPLFALAILAWVWKIAIHLGGWDGWR